VGILTRDDPGHTLRARAKGASVPFTDDSDVVVKELDDRNWQLMSTLTYQGKQDHFVVRPGMHTDFASVPRVFVWLLPRYGRYTKAAILHDYLWREEVPKGLKRADADGIFRRAMRELGVAFLRRWMMWTAVRTAAFFKGGGRKRWLRDSWLAFPVAILALPIVLPPAAVIMAALAAFFLLELALWIPMKATFEARTAIQKRRPRKQVNVPRLDWRLS